MKFLFINFRLRTFSLSLKILVVQLLELHLQGVCRAHKCVKSEPIHPQIYTNKASLADDEMCAFILHELNTLCLQACDFFACVMMAKLRERQLLNALFMGRHGLIDNVYTVLR